MVVEENAIGRSQSNPYVKDGKALLSKIDASGNLKSRILRAVNIIGGFDKVIEKGDDVLLKVNYNSADPSPASSEPMFVKSVIDLLYEQGAGKVILGESSMQLLSTRRVMKRTGTLDMVKDTGAEVVFFDEGKWVQVSVDGKYLKSVSLPERAVKVKKVVYCCCMKTHFLADFSMTLKLAFGFVKASERNDFHRSHLKEKMADLNLVVHPNLLIMDGRKCFITGGPFKGEAREPNLVLASGDRVAMDVEGIKVIESFEGAKLKDSPWSYTQIQRAVELGLGVKSEQEYVVITDA